MLKNFFNTRHIKKYTLIVNQINIEFNKIDSAKTISQQLKDLKENTNIKNKHKVILAMALAKKAAKEVLGMTYYDVQLIGALALVDGIMAEMKTGEGKTLTCSAAVVANYVLGYSTHVATANEYLAIRDEETLHKLYQFMGITSGVNTSQITNEAKSMVYANDVVYSTAQEFGFDFLRDNLIYNMKDKIQPLYFDKLKCIIDEADFVLIDEARTPLIISGESPVTEKDIYHKIKTISTQFIKIKGDYEKDSHLEGIHHTGDFWVDEKQKNIYLSENGYSKLEQFTKTEGILLESKQHNSTKSLSPLYDDNNSWIINEFINALKAQYLYIKDKDYVIKDDSIIIIDPNTGRLSHGRTWSSGLHQAIETKENLIIHPENMTLGSISIQNYFKNYYQISGMSGTIVQSSEEFHDIYNCDTIQIPTNKPVIRIEHQDQIYINTESKYKFMLAEILRRHNKGQPILIGTISVAESEIISNLLHKENIKHQVLNAKNNSLEAQIISQAGQPSKVTVSTSMAGRGTDIILGGNKDSINDILNQQLQQINERISFAHDFTNQLNIEAIININLESIKESIVLETFHNQEKINRFYEQDNFINELTHNPHIIWNTLYQLQYSIEQQIIILDTQWEHWRAEVLNCGGLCVIGSSRNESRRIDDQLRGRAGRQGDPGENIFYMSLEDPWVNIFGKSALFSQIIKNLPHDQLISSPTITKIFAKAQHNIESHHFDIRKNTYEYDSIKDESRIEFLELRNNLLLNQITIKNLLYHKLFDDLSIITYKDFIPYIIEKYNLDTNISIELLLNYPLQQLYQFIEDYSLDTITYNKNKSTIYNDLLDVKITNIINNQNHEIWEELNFSLIKELDNNWSHHLDFIDEAQKNVAFSSLAQKNPIHEYKKICFNSFAHMLNRFKDKSIQDFINKVTV
jgi:preprotein translocase subunit SecA